MTPISINLFREVEIQESKIIKSSWRFEEMEERIAKLETQVKEMTGTIARLVAASEQKYTSVKDSDDYR